MKHDFVSGEQSLGDNLFPPHKRLRSSDLSPTIYSNRNDRFSSSQPSDQVDTVDGGWLSSSYNKDFVSNSGFSFSQPAQLENLLVSSQLLSTQTCGSQTYSLQSLVRRMTRFFVSVSPEEAASCLIVAFETVGLPFKTSMSGCFTVTTIDQRKTPLVFKANIFNMDGETMVDFRLSKGCGLEFKRRFVLLRKCLNEIVIKKCSLLSLP